MDNAMAFLKRKGPLGMPMAFWVAFAAIVLYLGYRWFKGRGGSSSSDTSSSDTSGGNSQGVSDGTTTDTIPGGQIDTTEPPTSTIQPPTTGDINPGGPEQPLTVPDTGGNKTKRKHKKPKRREHSATHHDHKQGTHHTSHRRLPKAKSPHHHPPKAPKRSHSKEKAHTTAANIPSPPPQHYSARNNAAPAPSVKSRVPKSLPAAPQREPGNEKTHKNPPIKQSVVRKAA